MSIPFQLQEKLGFTIVLLPFYKNEELQLSGTMVNNFYKLSNRIEIGKLLYSLLFHIKEVYDGGIEYVYNHKHTGSRADIIPTIFTQKKHETNKIYSPALLDAWKPIIHKEPKQKDWFVSLDEVLPYYNSISINSNYNITNKYLINIWKLTSIDAVKNYLEIK